MPIILKKHSTPQRALLRDTRPVSVRMADAMEKPNAVVAAAIIFCSMLMNDQPYITANTDVFILFTIFYFRWIFKRPFVLPFKLPKYANLPDANNPDPGKPGSGKSAGIMFIGNVDDKDAPEMGQELWLTNEDARTHILYLGTTGSGKTEGLKALATNSLAWGSGFVYIDGKADTDLWASIYALARRFGRDDDLLVLNYMTGNTDSSSVSNSMNPFSNGSSSYLANMITNFMPDAGGDNAMWKERAVALMFALLPALTYKRDHQGMLLDIGKVRDHIELQPIIRLSRDPTLPERVTHALNGYLHTLPGFVDAAFDDEGNERPPSPDQPMYDLQVARQQHGYLSMQFTRSLQMMADEYGYIFKAQLADVDVLDVVLNRRILVVLIPALEKSGDEAANLGKIVAASLKGMMGATLGNTVEGSWEMAIGSKQTRSSSSFITIFDEVGYYTAQGMAVMAAQARSLGFSLIFASQDLPSMEKRVKQEAKSITANCNLKIFGRIEDPTDTKDFLTKHGGTSWVLETKGMVAPTNTISSLFMSMPMYDERGTATAQVRQRVDYDHLRDQREGEAHVFFADWAYRVRMFYVAPEKVKALRVHRFLPVPATTSLTAARERNMQELAAHLKDTEWTAVAAAGEASSSIEIDAILKAVKAAETSHHGMLEAGTMVVAMTTTLPAPKPKDMVANGANGANGTNGKVAIRGTTPKGPHVSIPDIPETIDRRVGMPPLYEGDQYAIDEVERAPGAVAKPVTIAKSGAPVQQQQKPPAQQQAAAVGYAGSETDFNVVTHPQMAEDEVSVMDVELPPDIAGLLEQSARKLSQGLAGSEGQKS